MISKYLLNTPELLFFFPKIRSYQYIRLLSCFIYFKFLMMNNGTVKFFNESKGYGFITPDDGGKDVFVHVNGLIDDIREGDKVNYETEEGRKGLNAVEVKLA